MIILPREGPSAKRARDHVGKIVEEWAIDSDDVRVVVSELVTNAIRYAKTENFWVDARVELERRIYLVEVWDADETLPTPGGSSGGDGGRGLLMVGELASGWGTRLVETGGKVVYAEWVIP